MISRLRDAPRNSPSPSRHHAFFFFFFFLFLHLLLSFFATLLHYSSSLTPSISTTSILSTYTSLVLLSASSHHYIVFFPSLSNSVPLTSGITGISRARSAIEWSFITMSSFCEGIAYVPCDVLDANGIPCLDGMSSGWANDLNFNA